MTWARTTSRRRRRPSERSRSPLEGPRIRRRCRRSLRQAIAGVDREIAVFDVQTMTDRADRSLGSRRSSVVLSTTFGAVAMVLSALGIYAVLACLVAQRTKEIGIRMAIGASRLSVFRLIVREGVLLIAAGILLGAVGTVAAGT